MVVDSKHQIIAKSNDHIYLLETRSDLWVFVAVSHATEARSSLNYRSQFTFVSHTFNGY